MDDFSDAQLEEKIARVKASPEFAAYSAKLDEIVPSFSEAEKNLQSHLAALVQERRNRLASGTATAILQTVGAKAPEKRKLQRPTAWTSGGFVHTKQGGSKSEDLSCKRQFDKLDKADDVFFEVKQQLEGLEAPESITEERIAKVKKAQAAIEEEFVDCPSEFDEAPATEVPGVPEVPRITGRLRQRVGFWRSFASALVVTWILFGAPLTWIAAPPPSRFSANAPSALAEAEFVTQAVFGLVQSGAAEEWLTQPTVVSPLGVAYRDMGPDKPPKKRLIWNGRYVNSFIVVQKFKYESLAIVRDLLFWQGSLWSFDLTSGYHHVELHQDFHTYVAFSWQERFYVLKALPFGLAPAPYFFTKITNELAARWRRQGAGLVHYLDDFLFIQRPSGRPFAEEQAAVLRDVEDSGFLVNQEKSVLGFQQLIEFLGIGIDSVRGVFYVPQKKWDSFQARVTDALGRQWISPRELSRLAGKIQSFSLALGKVCQMFSREMYFEVERHTAWDKAIRLTEEVAEELRFWLSVQRRQFEAPIWPVFLAFRNRMWTDAGGTGWGAVLEAVTGRKSRRLDGLWGQHTVDRFATDKNALLPRFNSRWWCPGSENIDCFSLTDWWLENNWCNPPFGLVGRLLEVLRRFSAVATIIVPYWTGRHWWPILCPDGQHFAPFVRDWRELPRDTAEALFLPRGHLDSAFWRQVEVSPRDPLEQELLRSMKLDMVTTRAVGNQLV
ncbi:hypothetical protein CYMTET_21853 [Cymbomonas tetramitiformis]|uniref:Reverse transcriptase domain-containing protein n=1 Tax=Cymbomonas tetramitiformis TaxID=36881 RepID=A0AAE0G1D2_9CHLO|nr:hypothetical protein CYMTET_21853 [Cymbomonas tetramitiformis]